MSNLKCEMKAVYGSIMDVLNTLFYMYNLSMKTWWIWPHFLATPKQSHQCFEKLSCNWCHIVAFIIFEVWKFLCRVIIMRDKLYKVVLHMQMPEFWSRKDFFWLFNSRECAISHSWKIDIIWRKTWETLERMHSSCFSPLTYWGSFYQDLPTSFQSLQRIFTLSCGSLLEDTVQSADSSMDHPLNMKNDRGLQRPAKYVL